MRRCSSSRSDLSKPGFPVAWCDQAGQCLCAFLDSTLTQNIIGGFVGTKAYTKVQFIASASQGLDVLRRHFRFFNHRNT